MNNNNTFKEMFGFEPANFGNIENDIVAAKLRELAIPYHTNLRQEREIKARYNQADHGVEIAAMIADHATLVDLRKSIETARTVFYNAYNIAKLAGISVEENIDKYQTKTPAK